MTAIIGRFTKQPSEILDYDVDFSDWFEGRTDTPASFTAAVDAGTVAPGVTAGAGTPAAIVSATRTGNVIKVILSGGRPQTKYKVTVQLTTVAGLLKEADFTVAVKES